MMPCTVGMALIVLVIIGTYVIYKIEGFLEKRKLKKIAETSAKTILKGDL